MKQKFRNQVIIWILVAVFLSETAMESMAAGRAILSAPYAVSEAAVKKTAKTAAEVSLEGAVETETSKKETEKTEETEKQTTKAETSRKETTKAETSKKETTKAETSKGETTKAETSKEETTKAETSKDETTKAESSQEESTKEESSKKESDGSEPSKEGSAETATPDETPPITGEETVGKGTDSNGSLPPATGSDAEKNADQQESKGMLRQLWDKVLDALDSFFSFWKRIEDDETKYHFNQEESIVDKLTRFIDSLRHPETVMLRTDIASGSEASVSDAQQYLEQQQQQWELERRQEEESLQEEQLLLDEKLLQPETELQDEALSQDGELLQDDAVLSRDGELLQDDAVLSRDGELLQDGGLLHKGETAQNTDQKATGSEASGGELLQGSQEISVQAQVMSEEPAEASVLSEEWEAAVGEASQITEEDSTSATRSNALKSSFFRSARAAGGNVLTGTQSGDGMTLAGDYTLENFSYTANPTKSAITVAKGSTLTLYIKGTVTLNGGDGALIGMVKAGSGIHYGGGAGIEVPKGSTLIVIGDKGAVLNARGGHASAAVSVWAEMNTHCWYGGSGGGAGIGGRGGSGGTGRQNYQGPGGNGSPSSTGKIYILSPILVNATGGDTYLGGPGRQGDAGDAMVNTILTPLPIVGGFGGDGGGGNGGPGAGIGGGGVGGGGTSEGGENVFLETAPIYNSNVGGSGGSGGGGGYSSNGGGGGGGGIAGIDAGLLISAPYDTAGGNAVGIGEDGLDGGTKDGSEGGRGGKAGRDGKGGAGGRGGKGNTSDMFHADGRSGAKGGDAGEYSTVEDIIICKEAVVTVTPGHDPGTDGPLKGGQIDAIGQGGSPSYTHWGTPKDGYWLDSISGIRISQDTYDYDGTYHKPEVIMSEEIKKGCEITYVNNQNAGTGQVRIVGKEDLTGVIPYVRGSRTFDFKINKVPMNPPPAIKMGSSSAVLGDSIPVTASGNIAEAKVTFTVTQGVGTVEDVVNGLANIKSGVIGKLTVKAQFAETQNYLPYECTAEAEIKPRPIGQCYIAPIPEQAYTGSAISPDLEISYGGKVLVKGVDYEASYENNTEKGTATIRLTGKGNFTDTATTYFTISTASITGAAVSAISDVTYNGKAFTPTLTLTFGGKTLVNGPDYLLSYENNVTVGTASVHIIGQGGYTGEKTVTFKIRPRDLTAAVSSAIPNEIFNGTEIKKHPELRIILDGDSTSTLLQENTDYILEYANNLLAGTATVTARGQGNYTGTKAVTFQITKRQLTVVPEKGMTKEKGDSDPADLGTRYTFTNGISGFTPVFEGKLSRDAGENTGNYQIRQGTLKLTGAAVNANYTLALATEYFGIVEPADILSEIRLSGTYNSATGWYTGPVTISNARNLDMSLSNSQSSTNTWTKTLSYPDGDYHKGGVTCYLRENGRVSKPQYVKFKQDTEAPSGSILIGAHSWNSLLNNVTFGYFFKDTVEVRILGTDYTSGVKTISYLTSATALTEAQVKAKPASAWKEGDHFTTTDPKVIVYAKIQDAAGFVTYVSTDGIIYDKDMPVLSVTYPSEDTWTSDAGAAIAIAVKDTGSGLKDRYITYKIGSEPVQTMEIKADGTVGKNLADLPDGDYSVWINAADKAGNTSNTREVKVKKDTTPPEVTLTAPPSWEKQDVTVTVHAEDADSPVTAWQYSLDGGSTWSGEAVYGSTDPTFTVRTDGAYDKVLVRVKNAAGLVTTTKAGDLAVLRDTKKPEVRLVVTDFGYHDATDHNRWYRDSAPLLSFDAPYTAQEAPVEVYWKIWKDGSTEPADYQNVREDQNPAVSGEGVYQVKYYGLDKAGNQSEIKTEAVRYDNVAPAFGTPPFTASIAGDSALEKFGNQLTFGNFFKEGVLVTISGEDKESGLEAVRYTVNGGEEKTVTGNSFLIEKGTSGRIVLRLMDKAGNVSSQVLQKDGGADEWMVEDNPPVIDPLTTRTSKDSSDGSDGTFGAATSSEAVRVLPNKEGWYRTDLVVSTNISDGDSGLNSLTGIYNTENGNAGTIDQRFPGDQKKRDFQYSQELAVEGKNTLYLKAEDNAGNSTDISQDFYIDKTKPALTLTSSHTDTTKSYVNQVIHLTLTAADAVSGLAKLDYTLDGGVSWETKTYTGEDSDGPLDIPLEDGSYGDKSIQATVWDRAGNSESTFLNLAVTQDTKAAPEAVLTVTPGAGGAYDKTRNWYTGPKPTISLTLEERKTGEGANYGYWKLWNETAGETEPMGDPSDTSGDPRKQGWSCIHEYGVVTESGVVMKRDLPIINGEGIYHLKYYTIDDAENSDDKDSPHEAVIRWDNSRPEYASPSYAVAKVDNTPLEDVGQALSFGNFYKDRVRVSVDVDDTVSGLESLSYTVNDKAPQTVDLSDPQFTLPLGTSGTVYVTAVDQAGLSSQIQILGKDSADMWYLETNKPVIGDITTTVQPSQWGWYREDLPLQSTVLDEDSGLKAVEWKVGTDPAKQKTEKFSLTSIQHIYHFSQTLAEEGQDVEVTIGAEDLAGNISDTVKKTFSLDKTKPTVKSLRVKNPADYQAGVWTNAVVAIEAEVEDTLSGIAKAAYTTDGGKTWIETSYPADAAAKSQTITFDLTDGIYPEDKKLIQVKAWDFADNETDNVSQGLLLPSVQQDATKPPVPELKVTTRGTYNQDTKWYAGPAPELSLSLEAGRADETANQIYWKLWNTEKGETEPAEWSAGVPVIRDDPSANGKYILKYFAQDAVKNASEVKTADIWWDNTIPVYEEPPFTYEQEDGGIWSDIGNFLTFGNYFKKGVRVTVHTRDELSGVQKIAYSINSGAYQSVQLTGTDAYRFLIPENTVGQIMIEVTDLADNTAARLVLGSKDGAEWILEGTAPVIGDVTTDSIPSEYGWFSKDIALIGTAFDRDSGLKTIRHKLGSSDEVVEEMTASGSDAKAASNSDVKTVEYEYNETLSEEGEITLSLSAEDNALNKSSRTFTFRLDKTEPENVRMKVAAPAGLASGEFANSDVTIEVSAGDLEPKGGKASGVKRFAWSIDNGKTWVEQPYDPADGSKNRFIIGKDGFYDENNEDVILLKVWDGAGNCHETKAEGDELLRVGRDIIAPPRADLTITPDATGKNWNTSGRIWYNGDHAPKIGLTVATASVAESPNHVCWILNPEGSVPPVADDWERDGEPKLPDKGAYTLNYYTEDEAGNVTDKASPVTVPVRYDPDPPVYGGFTFKKKGGGLIDKIGSFLGFGNFFKEEVEVEIDVSDPLSGLSRVTYSIDGSTAKEITDLTNPSFTIPVGTTGKIEVEAVDHAGNRAETVVLGASGHDSWQLETRPPVIGDIVPASPSNADGWYRQDLTVSAAVSDGESGLFTVDGLLGSKTDSRPMNQPTASPSSAVKEYEYINVLEGEGAALNVKITATDNALNTSSKSASFKIDQTKPEISITPGKGFPTVKTGEQPIVEFDVTDSLSGVRRSSIEVKKDGKPLAVTTADITNGCHCMVTLDGNGTYTIDAEDIAGNPADTYTENEILIDTGSPEAAEVSISPANPDGKNGWYVTIPKIHISIPAQAGVADITTYYTVTLSGQPEGTPKIYNPDRPESGPEIPESGIWEVHVWRENEFHVKSGTEFRTVLKVETLFPKNLSITGMPDVCVNTNVTLTAHAEATGLTRLERWRHSLDGKKSWSGWRDWKQDGENQFEITTDLTKEDDVIFEVEDYAGNSTASNAVKVWRDTVAPVLSPASPSNAAEEVPVSTKLEMDVSKPVSKGAGGSVQVYNAQTAVLWCEVPIASDRIEIQEKEKKLTVTLPYALEADTIYYVQTPKGLVKDVAGNESPTMGGRKGWQFRTALTEAELELEGYDIQTFSTEDGKEYTAWMKAVQYDSAGKVYQAVVQSSYEDEDGNQGAKLHVEPVYTGKPGEITVSTLNTDVKTEVNPNGSFEVWLPDGSGVAELIAASDGAELGRLRVALIGAEFSAEADGILNPEIIEPEVLNSVDLYQDVSDPNVSAVKFELKTEPREEDRGAYPETGDPVLEEMVRVNLPQGTTKIKLLDMGITKTTSHGDGTESKEILEKLDNPITVSLDMPEDIVGYKYLNMVRVHKGDVDFIPVTLSGDKKRGTIATDRFSDYAILGSNMPMGGSSSHGGGGERVTRNVTTKEKTYQDRFIIEEREDQKDRAEAEPSMKNTGKTAGEPDGQENREAIESREINPEKTAMNATPDGAEFLNENQKGMKGWMKRSAFFFPLILLGILLALAAFFIGQKQAERKERHKENRRKKARTVPSGEQKTVHRAVSRGNKCRRENRRRNGDNRKNT